LILAKYGLEILFGCPDRLDVEVFGKHIKYCGAYECRERGAEPDPIYTQMEERQEYAYRFLLVP